MLLRLAPVLLLAASCSAQMLRPSTFGPLWGWDSLSNTPIKSSIVDYRIVLDHGGSTLNTIKEYYIYHDAYGGGTGGTIQVYLQTDDGTANHRPSGTTVGSTQSLTFDRVHNQSSFETSTLNAAGLTQGQIIHILHKNVDASPLVNWVSLDLGSCLQCATKWAQPAPNQPGITELISTDNGATWTENYLAWPIFSMAFADNYKQGQPFYDSTRLNISTYPVRESIIPASSVSGNAITVYLLSATGGNVTMTLQDASFATIASSTIAVAPSATSAFYTFPISQTTLSAATQYYVQLAGSFTIRALENGGASAFPWTAPYTGSGCQLYNGTSWANCNLANQYDLPIGLVSSLTTFSGKTTRTGQTAVQ